MKSSRLLYISENISRLRKQDQVVGSFLYDRYQEPVARIEGLLTESRTFLVRYLSISLGGFLNIHGKIIVLPYEVCTVADLGKVKTTWSKESIQDAPNPVDPERITVDEEELILSYFDLEPYWAAEPTSPTP